MYIIIAGGGRTGTHLASSLLEQGHQVHLLEHRGEVIGLLHRELPTEVIFEGPALDTELLTHVGLAQADVLAACTANDADNLALCYLARHLYQVPRTIARVNNPRHAWLFNDHFHVDVALNQAEILSGLIAEEMSLGDMMTLAKLRRGQYALVEEKIPAGAKAVGIAIKDLVLPAECIIAAIIRESKMIVPRGITTFEVGDEVLAITNQSGAIELAKLFASPTNGNGRAKN